MFILPEYKSQIYLVSGIAESKDPGMRERKTGERGIPGAARRAGGCKIYYCYAGSRWASAIDTRLRKKKQYFVTIVYVFERR